MVNKPRNLPGFTGWKSVCSEPHPALCRSGSSVVLLQGIPVSTMGRCGEGTLHILPSRPRRDTCHFRSPSLDPNWSHVQPLLRGAWELCRGT